MLNQRLDRSRSDRMIAGVCGGIAQYFGIDSTIVRLFTVLAAIVSGGAVVLIYFVMWIVVPEETFDNGGTVAQTEARAGSSGEPASAPGPDPFASPFRTSGFGGTGSPTDEQRRRRSQWIGWALLAVGSLILVSNLHLFSWVQWNLIWPAALILGGVYLLLRQRRGL